MINWTKGTLRVFSDSMAPAEIGKALGITATDSFEKGSRASARTPNSMIRDRSIWLLESGLPDGATLEAQVEALLGILEAHSERVAILSPQCEFDLFFGVRTESGQGAFTLDSALFARLATLPVSLSFDLYGGE